MQDLLEVPEARRAVLTAMLDRLRAARRVVLTTHVNSDGDGCGSEVAVAAWLEEEGVEVRIVNPTPWPPTLAFLLYRPDLALDPASPAADEALRAADLVLVLDTSEPNRVAPLTPRLDPERTMVVDHHPAGPSVVGTLAIQDPTAAAAGELVFDLLTLAGASWQPPMVLGVYVAIVSDTGSFRFTNTTPRVHALAAEMLARGVNPEDVFRRLFATYPRRRFELLREALASLDTDTDLGISWIVVPHEVADRLGATHEDFDGLIDHARAVEGTRVAILFRGLPDGTTKLSLRSTGSADVNRIARAFGGGGHVKAAGGHVDVPPAEAVPRVLQSVRAALNE